MGVVLALAGTGLYALTNVLVRRASRQGGLGDGYLLTVLFNALTFGAVLTWMQLAGMLPPLRPGGLASFVAAGLATTFLGRRLLFSALACLGPARSLPFKVTSPVFTAVLAAVFLQESLSPALLGGIAAVAVGLWLLSREQVQQEEAQGEPSPHGAATQRRPLWSDPVARKGALLAFLSGASFGTGHFFRKLGLLEIPSEWVGVAVGAWVALAAGWLTSRPPRSHPSGSPRPSDPSYADGSRLRRPLQGLASLPWEYWAGGVCTTLAMLLQFASVRMMPVSTVSVVFASEPLWSMAAARLLLEDEVLTWRVVFSAVLVVAGIAVVIQA